MEVKAYSEELISSETSTSNKMTGGGSDCLQFGSLVMHVFAQDKVKDVG